MFYVYCLLCYLLVNSIRKVFLYVTFFSVIVDNHLGV